MARSIRILTLLRWFLYFLILRRIYGGENICNIDPVTVLSTVTRFIALSSRLISSYATHGLLFLPTLLPISDSFLTP